MISIRLFYGKDWLKGLFKECVVGNALIKADKNYLNEIPKLKEDYTYREVTSENRQKIKPTTPKKSGPDINPARRYITLSLVKNGLLRQSIRTSNSIRTKVGDGDRSVCINNTSAFMT